MAIVFISPKAKRKTFFKIIGVVAGLVLTMAVFIFLITELLPKSSVPAVNVSSNPLDVKINFSIVDSQKVKDLEPFDYLEMSFAYVVSDKDGKEISGNVSAANQQEAKRLLEEGGFKVMSLREAGVGRAQPFISF